MKRGGEGGEDVVVCCLLGFSGLEVEEVIITWFSNSDSDSDEEDDSDEEC